MSEIQFPGAAGLVAAAKEVVDAERAERPVLRSDVDDDPSISRSYPTEVTPAVDGRTIDVRIVPYGERIKHNDGKGGLPKGAIYEEEFTYGAFANQVKAKGREREVTMNLEHDRTVRGIVGHGLAFREEADGLYGSFTFLDHPDGDKALMLVRERVITGVSLEALPKRSIRTAAGIVQRVRAHLYGIALTNIGAYAGARVLALREAEIEEEIVLDEALMPPRPSEEALERCRRLGIALPQRYEAHPAQTDTPADAGTSADGTRPETTQKPSLRR